MDSFIWQIVIASILFTISSIAKAVQDTLLFHFDTSVFKNAKNKQYWDPKISYRNKWKNGESKQGEKFLGSSTIFVIFTDAWHLFGAIRDLSSLIIAPIITLNPYYLLIYPGYRLSFHIFFTYIFNKKHNGI